MNNPFDYTPDAACVDAFRELLARLEAMRKSDIPGDVNFIRELDNGKMLGVLIATDTSGIRHTLYAFSGQLGDSGFHHHGFVGPAFDYLKPDGYFRKKEAGISRLSTEISLFENGPFSRIKSDFEQAEEKIKAEISEYKEKYRLSRMERKARRESGLAGPEELAAMIRLSQFEKAELHRLKKRLEAGLQPLADNLKKARACIDSMKEKRRSESESLQRWLFSSFRLQNARGESKSLSEIFADTPTGIPPSGAGECCAPKLLQAAYQQNLRPVAMAEYWYGKPKGGEVRIHGTHYPACRGKCLPVLQWMLQGLRIEPPLDSDRMPSAALVPEIIYENQWFCVVSKPAGMLSVPGKGASLSVQQWLSEKYGSDRLVRMAHRLDQDTSGLLIATFGQLPFKTMQSLFAMRKVKKTYVAELDGDYKSRGLPRQGHIELPVSPDWLDRPRQHVDFESGKPAATDYEFISVSAGRSRIIFRPLTGRTHQLRVHAASEMGLGIPIAGDRLYGRNGGKDHQRLFLHAWKLEFTFPTDGRKYCFEIPVPF